MNKLKTYFLLLCTLLTSTMHANNYLQDDMKHDLAALKYNMSLRYAPKAWKNTLFNWNLEDEFQKANNHISNNNSKTSADFHKIFKNMLQSTRDYHVNAHFYSRELSVFPMVIKEAEGRYFITSMDIPFELNFMDFLLLDLTKIEQWEAEIQNMVSSQSVYYSIGDEIIAINGMKIESIVENLINEELGGDRSPTGYSLASAMIYNRLGKYGHDTPEGTFKITILRQGESKSVTYDLPWLHLPEDILKRGLPLPQDPPPKQIESVKDIKRSIQQSYCVAFAKDIISHRTQKGKKILSSKICQRTEEPEEIAYIKGFLPPLGRVLWKTSKKSNLYGYIYKNKSGKNIGYVYLPTFYYNDDEMEEVLKNLEEILIKFKAHTDALVFDITDNPGGRSDFMNNVIAMLSDTPIITLEEQEVLTQENVYQAMANIELVKFLSAEEGKEISEEGLNLINTLTQIIENYKAGKSLSDPVYLFGEKEILPNPRIQYTKPKLVLVNELDFSCGDFFPAMIQDNDIAKIFGKKTAGAGGYVKGYTSNSRFGVAGYSLTGSIGYRFDGSPIENNGVTPDLPYDLTAKDLQRNFIDYSQTVNSEIETLLKK